MNRDCVRDRTRACVCLLMCTCTQDKFFHNEGPSEPQDTAQVYALQFHNGAIPTQPQPQPHPRSRHSHAIPMSIARISIGPTIAAEGRSVVRQLHDHGIRQTMRHDRLLMCWLAVFKTTHMRVYVPCCRRGHSTSRHTLPITHKAWKQHRWTVACGHPLTKLTASSCLSLSKP